MAKPRDQTDGKAVVTANYDMPAVKGKLELKYVVDGNGVVNVTEQFTADKTAEVSGMFRFGMRMSMPASFENIEYYGRGPGENYSDRQNAMNIGLYRQSVTEQPYAYIRAQETGTRTDLRHMTLLNSAGNGLEITASAPFSASALHYTVESLDGGEEKTNTHFPEIAPQDLTEVCIDMKQMGLACVNSWGAIALPQYRVPYGDYKFNYTLTPVRNNVPLD